MCDIQKKGTAMFVFFFQDTFKLHFNEKFNT